MRAGDTERWIALERARAAGDEKGVNKLFGEIFSRDDKVFKSAMSLDEASKMILSAGLVAPASFERDMGPEVGR